MEPAIKAPADPGRAEERIDLLALYCAAYLAILGAQYALVTQDAPGFPLGYHGIRGWLHVAVGLALLWAAMDAFRPLGRLAAYAAAAALVAATSANFLASGQIGLACAQGLLSALLLACGTRRAPLPFDATAVVVGTAPLFTGLDAALLGRAPIRALPDFGLSASAAAWMYVACGFAMLAAIKARGPWRLAIHLTAGGALSAHYIAVGFVAGAAVVFSGAATWFRLAVTTFLPVLHVRLQTASLRQLRVLLAASFATVTFATAMTAAFVTLQLLDPGRSGAQFARIAAMWLVVGSAVAGTAVGVVLATRIVDALRAARGASAPPAEAVGDPEFETVRSLFDAHARRLAVLEHQLEQRDDYLGGVGHDLRNPLSAVAAGSDLIARHPEDRERVLRLAHAVHASAEEMKRMIDAMLLSVRLKDGRMPMHPAGLDVNGVLAELRERFALGGNEGRLTIVGAEATVFADPSALARILTNLVDNALKYSPAGSPVRVEVRPATAGIRFEVSDHGPGIPPEDRERVFDRYYRLQRHGGSGGIGLGLYISRRLAEECGGHLWTEPSALGGTRMVVELPGTTLPPLATERAVQTLH